MIAIIGNNYNKIAISISSDLIKNSRVGDMFRVDRAGYAIDTKKNGGGGGLIG